jgi:hypothetical protein
MGEYRYALRGVLVKFSFEGGTKIFQDDGAKIKADCVKCRSEDAKVSGDAADSHGIDPPIYGTFGRDRF